MNTRNVKQDLKNVITKNLEPFPENFEVETFELFDDYGILISKSPVSAFKVPRYEDEPSNFAAIYLNGELALFIEGEETIFSRIQNIPQIIEQGGF